MNARFAVLLFATACVAPAPRANAVAAPETETLLLQSPSISREHVVFVHAEDLWVASRSGGAARRLTTSPGTETAPKISPDGRLVAFSGQYDGDTDVYVVSIEGGAPRRLTWHPDVDRVQGWHPDGARILFTSRRASDAPVDRAFLVGLDGSMPEALPAPRVARAALDPTARKLAYTPFHDAFRTWKRYRGGRTTPIWVLDLQSLDVEVVPHENASDSWPCFAGDWLYFASDRGGTMNLFRYRLGSKRVEPVTEFRGFDVSDVSSDGTSVVFAQAGAIHVHDPAAGRTERLSIHVSGDQVAALPRWERVGDSIRAAALAPSGRRVAFEARGEILTAPKEHGDVRNLTATPGVHERSPAFSADGKRIAYFTDAGGEYRLAVRDHLGREEPTYHSIDAAGFYHDPAWSPDGTRILFNDKANSIWYLTLETGEKTKVAECQGSLGVVRPAAVWSPDSRFIAYEDRNPRTTYDRIAIHEVETGVSRVLTDDFAVAGSPAFSRDGKLLFFRASVEAGPTRFGLDMSASSGRDVDHGLYAAVLAKDGEHPFAPKSDEAVPEQDGKGKRGKDGDKDEEKDEEKDGKKDGENGDEDPGEERKNGDGDQQEANGEEPKDAEGDQPAARRKKKEPPKTVVDFEGLDQRVVALPLRESGYIGLACTEKKLLILERSEGRGAELKAFDFEKREAKSIAENVQGFDVAADGKSILVRGNRGWQIMSESGGDKKDVGLGDYKVRVDPAQEWPQVLREVWRLQRDYFYDPNLHGVDWPAMWDRWSPFLAHVHHRSDLNELIAELIGELACGHEYVSGGETPRGPEGTSVGLLGADFEVADGRYRFARILRGQNWNPDLRAPLTEPGVDVREGDYLIAVDGRPITSSENLFAAFENSADRQVELTVSAAADGAAPRKSTVVPLRNEGRLRRLSWIEGNRRRVAERSGGRVAYIYMPDTSTQGWESFQRDFFSQLDKQGLVLDERYNGGGKVADSVIEILSRDVRCYWMNREQWVGQSPFAAFPGPKAMVINERAGSGGDAMPWLFQRAGLGPLVGNRTWGGLVGISGYPPLMDGGSVTAANFGVMDTDGNWAVENVGVAPDHEVLEWPKQVAAGEDPPLDKAVDLVLEALAEAPPRALPTYRPPAVR